MTQRAWGGGTYHIWPVFLGDDSGCRASRLFLELGHLQGNGNKGGQHDLGVLVDLGKILLIAVDVQSDGGARAPSAAQSKDDARTICKKEPQALGKITALEGRVKAGKF